MMGTSTAARTSGPGGTTRRRRAPSRGARHRHQVVDVHEKRTDTEPSRVYDARTVSPAFGRKQLGHRARHHHVARAQSEPACPQVVGHPRQRGERVAHHLGRRVGGGERAVVLVDESLERQVEAGDRRERAAQHDRHGVHALGDHVGADRLAAVAEVHQLERAPARPRRPWRRARPSRRGRPARGA
jgi:hypothetical protein